MRPRRSVLRAEPDQTAPYFDADQLEVFDALALAASLTAPEVADELR